MPELLFRVRWPDDTTTLCYSPSSTIADAFTQGEGYPVPEFVERSRNALQHASERVAQKYGYGCAHATRQIEEIETYAARFEGQPDACVVVESFGAA